MKLTQQHSKVETLQYYLQHEWAQMNWTYEVSAIFFSTSTTEDLYDGSATFSSGCHERCGIIL